MVDLNKRSLMALRSKESARVTELPVRITGFETLLGNKHCLVVTYRGDGRPVAQPVWPGYDGRRAYVWTEEQAYKAKRIRANPAALIAPCSFRGVPLEAPIAARGRVLEDEGERDRARRVLLSQWGWKRRAFERISRPLTDVVYIELVPADG
jgi:PPOX class probable F420-dependent enzyme